MWIIYMLLLLQIPHFFKKEIICLCKTNFSHTNSLLRTISFWTSWGFFVECSIFFERSQMNFSIFSVLYSLLGGFFQLGHRP